MGSHSVFIVDDHAVVRRGVRALVESLGGFSCSGESSTPSVDPVRAASPDLAIVDLTFEGKVALDFVAALAESGTRVLVLSMHDERLYAERALSAGARAYVMKDAPTEQLEAAMRAVVAGRVWLSDRMTQRMLSAAVAGGDVAPASPLKRLTDRELEVFELIGHGSTTGEIAARLHLSVKTIESHKANIKRKLVLASGVELTRAAVAWVEVS